MDDGINLYEPNFTHGEAVEVSEVPSKILNNWIQRGVIDLGEKHRTGRRLFSVMDLIELKVMGQLNLSISVTPKIAAFLAGYARRRAEEMLERDEQGSLLYKGLQEEERQYLVAFFHGETVTVKVVNINDFFGKHTIPNAVIVIPLDDIVVRVQNHCVDIIERN